MYLTPRDEKPIMTTSVVRTERYVTNACIDRQDAADMAAHLEALIRAVPGEGRALSIAAASHETALHFARLVRVVQRATQPNVVARAACDGVRQIEQLVENGVRTFTLRMAAGDVVLDATRRSVRLIARR